MFGGHGLTRIWYRLCPKGRWSWKALSSRWIVERDSTGRCQWLSVGVGVGKDGGGRGGCGWGLRRGGRLVQTGGAAGVCVSKVNSSARQPVMTPATVCESVCLERFYTKASLPLPTVFLKLLCGKQRNKFAFTSITNSRFSVVLVSIPFWHANTYSIGTGKWKNWSGVWDQGSKAQSGPTLSHFYRYWDLFVFLYCNEAHTGM